MGFTNRTRCRPSPSRNSSKAVLVLFLTSTKLPFWWLLAPKIGPNPFPTSTQFSDPIWCVFWSPLGSLWNPLNRPWTYFGRPWSPCGRHGAPSGRPRGTQGGSTELQGSILIDLGSHFGSCWSRVRPFGLFSGACWHHFNPSPLRPTTHLPAPRHVLPTQKTPSGEHRRESIPLSPVRLEP